MCGLIGIIRQDNKPAGKSVRKRYFAQRSRGTEGFGYVAIQNGVLKNVERSAEEKPILDKVQNEQAAAIVFHHRTPTSIDNVAEAAHPILVRHKSFKHDYYVIHNGVISNSDTLKEKHEKAGYKYTTEGRYTMTIAGQTYYIETKWNDSESLAIELALLMEEKSTLVAAEGSIAFIMVQVEKATKRATIHFGRNYSSPLRYTNAAHMIAITSEGSGVEVLPHNLYTVNADYTITYKPQDFGDYRSLYPHTTGYLGGGRSGGGTSYHDGWGMYDDDEDAWTRWKSGSTGLGKQAVLPAPSNKTDAVLAERIEEWQEVLELEEEKRDAQLELARAIEVGNAELEASLTYDLECIDAELAAMRQELETDLTYHHG